MVVADSNCLVVEDVITSGSSVLETVSVLQDAGVGVSQAVVLLDREQGGRSNIEERGVAVTSLMTLSRLLAFLVDANKVAVETVATVTKFLSHTGSIPIPNGVLIPNHVPVPNHAPIAAAPHVSCIMSRYVFILLMWHF